MGKINLCIAMSLDGFIADINGSVDFLFEKPRVEPDQDYKNFYANIDMILFGSNTYEQITQSKDEKINNNKGFYPDKKCYVFSNKHSGIKDNIEFTNMSAKQFTYEVASKTKGLVWLFGGQKLIQSFIKEDLIDQYHIYIMPVLLGSGVPLFTPPNKRLDLKLTSFSKVDEMVKIFYDRVKN